MGQNWVMTLYTENEWPNFKEYILVVEEDEWQENNIRGFTKINTMNKLGNPLKRNLKPQMWAIKKSRESLRQGL